MTATIRRAQSGDIPFLAWVMLAAARSHLERGVWDVMIGGDESDTLRFLEALLASDTRSYCHHSYFNIAEVDGTPAAGMCGYDPAEAGSSMLARAVTETLAEAGYGREDALGVLRRSVPFTRCESIEPPDTWIVECVATKPDFRGRGVVRQLLEHLLEQGRGAGFGSAQISVLIGNVAAQRAYESVGFQPADEKRDAEFEALIGGPGIRRMVRSL